MRKEIINAIVEILLVVLLLVWLTEELVIILSFALKMETALSVLHAKDHLVVEVRIFVCVYVTTNSHEPQLVINLLYLQPVVLKPTSSSIALPCNSVPVQVLSQNQAQI
jgi:hypothetical protein